MQMGPDTARLKPEHFIAHLFSRQNAPEFAKLFDDTLRDIAISNNDIFAVKTDGGAKITLFDRVSEFITDPSKRDDFCRALINKLVDFSFERIFTAEIRLLRHPVRIPDQGLQQGQRRQIRRVLHPARGRQDHGRHPGAGDGARQGQERQLLRSRQPVPAPC